MATAHLLIASWWPEDRFGLGDGDSRPARIEVAFVRELKPAVPAPAPATRLLRGAARLAAPMSPASAAAQREPLHIDEALREVVTGAGEALPEIAPAPELAAALAALAPAAPAAPTPISPDPAAPAFEWPPSTRLSYRLSGNYRGPVEGQARVEWRLAGSRYQVSLEVEIGPPFAPLATRRLQSDGLVTEAGLEPRRYDEQTHVALRTPRRLSITLDPDSF